MGRGSGGGLGSARGRGLKWQPCPWRQGHGGGGQGSSPRTHGHRPRGSHRQKPRQHCSRIRCPSSPLGGTRSVDNTGRPRAGPQFPQQRPRLHAAQWPWQGLGRAPQRSTLAEQSEEHSLFAPAQPHTPHNSHHTCPRRGPGTHVGRGQVCGLSQGRPQGPRGAG